MTDVKVGEKKLRKDGSSSKVLADFELWKNDEPYKHAGLWLSGPPHCDYEP